MTSDGDCPTHWLVYRSFATIEKSTAVEAALRVSIVCRRASVNDPGTGTGHRHPGRDREFDEHGACEGLALVGWPDGCLFVGVWRDQWLSINTTLAALPITD